MQVEPTVERMHIRIQFDRHVDIEFITGKHENCQIKDLSLSGMYVFGDFEKHPEENCHVDLVQTGMSTELSLQALAKIARKDGNGMAIEFSSMTYDSYLFLQASLLNETDDSLLLKKILSESCPFEITDQPPETTEPITSFL